MIPKSIIQIRESPPEKYILDMIHQYCPEYSYILLQPADVLAFIREHPILDFPMTLSKYDHPEILKFYYLYFYGGVYLHPDAMFNVSIDKMLKSHTNVFIQSCLTLKHFFTGFVAVPPKSPILYELLVKTLSVENLNSFNFGVELYHLYLKYQHTLSGIHVYHEQMKKISANSLIAVVEEEQRLFVHYFQTKRIPYINTSKEENITIQKEPMMKQLKHVTIGVTINPKDLRSVYIVDVLSNLFLHIHLITSYPTDGCILYNSEEYKKLTFDILIVSGFILPFTELKKIKTSGCKLILYKTENEYIPETENVLFSVKDKEVYPYFADFKEKVFDQVWTPCPEKMHDYWKLRFRCPVIQVPFVWTPPPIGERYTAKRQSKRVACFETNQSVSNYALSSVFVCENGYRRLEDKNKLEKMYVTCTEHERFSVLQFSRMTYNLNLYMDKKLSVEHKFNPLEFMSKHADIVIAHQWGNQIQPVYLELAWMGWPVIHNSDLFKEIGYYYPQFNYTRGGDVLNYVISTHDKVIEEYTKYNRSQINRFLTSNIDNIQRFKLLIESLL